MQRKLLLSLLLLFPLASFAAGGRTVETVNYNDFVNPESEPAPAPVFNAKNKAPVNQDILDLAYVNKKLQTDPNNVDLLASKAALYEDLDQLDNAQEILNKIQRIQPNNAKAAAVRVKVDKKRALIPHNQLGWDQDQAYVSDLNSMWTYSSLYYYRLTDNAGKYGARVNYAARFGTTAEQYQLEAYPKFSKTIYGDFELAMANQSQVLFPQYRDIAELYFDVIKGMEFSIGQRFLRAQGVNIYSYTGTMGAYAGNYFLWFRPYFFMPQTAQLYEVGIRRYFDEKNKYIGLTIFGGEAPDIADFIPPIPVIIIKSIGFNLSSQFPLSKNWMIKFGGGYVNQRFPSGRLRQITDVSAGLVLLF